jgi:UDP-2,3-diacylglucosamine pyrophosphatase LpxH
LVLHGNHYYPFENTAWYSKVASKLNLWIWKATRFLGRRWNYEGFNFQSKISRRGFWYEQYAKSHRQRLLEEYSDNENVDAIIMGHTHLVAYHKYGKDRLYDGLSNTINKTYLEINDGLISVRKVRE